MKQNTLEQDDQKLDMLSKNSNQNVASIFNSFH